MGNFTLPFDTRQAALARVAKTKAVMHRNIMAFAEVHTFTTDELAIRWNCETGHVAPRVSELVKRGDLVASGQRRKTRMGALANVWIATKYATPAVAPANLDREVEISREEMRRQRRQDRGRADGR